jgi:hypothetical protein
MDVENTVVTESQTGNVVPKLKKRAIKRSSGDLGKVCNDKQKKSVCDIAIDPDVVAIIAKLKVFDDVTDDYRHNIHVSLTKMTVPYIKAVCRQLKLRLTGKKMDLVERVMHRYDTLIAGNLLQHKFKRAIVSRWLELHGPALLDRKSCVNDMDLMGDDIEDIPMDQLFSFQESGFVYAFDIATFSSLIVKGYPRRTTNPYTRDPIPLSVLSDYKRFLGYSTMLGRTFSIIHSSNAEQVSQHRTVENGVVDVDVPMSIEEIDFEISSTMYIVDSYGYYTNPVWVTGMNIDNLKRFMNDMVDIFTYRANLSRNSMMKIVHPSGILVPNPQTFRSWLRSETDVCVIKKKASELMKKLVMSGAERCDRELGTIYMLTALTLRCPQAAEAMPWLYESAN